MQFGVGAGDVDALGARVEDALDAFPDLGLDDGVAVVLEDQVFVAQDALVDGFAEEGDVGIARGEQARGELDLLQGAALGGH